MWKNKMIEQGFNYTGFTIKEMTDFFEIRVESLEPKVEKKKSSAAAKKSKKNFKKRKLEDSDSSVVESSEDSNVERCLNRKYCFLHSKCSRSTDNYNDWCAMVNQHKQKIKQKFQDL